jgi:HlyD family secretion protein
MKTLSTIISVFLLLMFNGCGNNADKTTIEAQGNIKAINIVVSSKVNGEVINIIKDEGEKVNEKDTVIIIDPEVYELRLAEATAILQQAEAKYNLLKKGARKEDLKQSEESLKQAQINLNLANKDKERMTNLHASKSITEKQFEDAIASYEIALAKFNSAEQHNKKMKNFARPEELQQAEANLNRALASVNLIKKNLRDCYVTSPSNGFIVKKFVEKGESVAAMSSLFQVANLNTVELVIYIPETKLGMVKLGQIAEITTDTYSDEIYEGRISFISPEAEFTPKNIQTKEERTKLVFKVKIKVDNVRLELKDGMPADVVIRLQLQD